MFYSNTQFGFGLGGPDMARIFDSSKTLIDSTAWPSHEAGVTFVRCPGVTQGVVFTDSADGNQFINSFDGTPNAANDCTPPIRINEVQANDATNGPDWVELTNVGNQPIDITGWVLADDKDTDGVTIPASAVPAQNGLPAGQLAPGAFVAFDVANEDNTFSGVTAPANVPFGLGRTGDEVRLYQSGAWSGTTYVAADLVDAFVFENTSTKSGGAVQPQTVTLPNGTWPASGTTVYTYARCSDGISLVVADGNGAWAATSHPTRGTANSCDGLFQAQAWPDTHNAQAVTTADNVDMGQNMSGLFYVPGETPAQDYMWGIQNGSSLLAGASAGDPGSLYKLVRDASGNWGPAAGWDKGAPVRFLNNATGEMDAEGVTAVDGKVYVTSERDNTNSDVSKISVVQVDPSHVVPTGGTLDGHTVTDANGDLGATHEWDLTDLMPPAAGGINPETGLNSGLPGDANLGIEAVAFVPDSYLTAAGFKDEHTGTAYNPTNYPNHIAGGIFLVGLEKTGKLYGYVFNDDNTWTRVATIATGFQTIQDLTWEPALMALWATCDNSCQGRSSVIAIDSATDANQGTFQVQAIHARPTGATDNLNNEGFTMQPASECADGTKSVFWSDDTDDGNHALRTASIDCVAPSAADGVAVTAHVAGTASNQAGWYTGPVTVTFTCDEVDAVLTTACPSSVTVSATTDSYSVGTLVDTLGLTHAATVPAINILGALTTTPKPTISGTAAVGETITANVGTWDAGVTTHYQWADGANVLATDASLPVTPALVGKTITLSVTGSKPGFADVVETVESAPVALGAQTSTTPLITGTAKVGETLTVHVAGWAPASAMLSYQWSRQVARQSRLAWAPR